MKHYKYTHAAPVIPQDIYIDECSTNLMEAHIYWGIGIYIYMCVR